ncbi:uncharacterized protein K02A2.6-like [Bombina bombina]|uniref:uncharacterized protein K02A2.6-like n=1 Tax=Bombina bombina TaxID=8345 RepID=UPI00235AF916|nr:uncharacterized protein K02A2.6-like [Bombina bombina]
MEDLENMAEIDDFQTPARVPLGEELSSDDSQSRIEFLRKVMEDKLLITFCISLWSSLYCLASDNISVKATSANSPSAGGFARFTSPVPVVVVPVIPLVPPDSLGQNIKTKYAPVFESVLGKVKNKRVRLQLKPGARPKFFKARTVPFALRAGVDAELRRLEELKIITPVHRSEWASPIVPVRKKDGQIRICGDIKMVLNEQLAVDKYPLPRTEEIFANLAGGQHFTKIDLKNAYLQLEVHPDSRRLLTINTHRGLFQYNRMVFGIAPAPAIWQRTMEELLNGLPYVQCLLDDMLITGRTEEEHRHNVERVLQRLMTYGLKVNLEKCAFMRDKLEFCGHVIDCHGLHTADDKVKALQEAPIPQNASQLRSYLGLLNYYHCFLPQLAHTLHPLHQLLETNRSWLWSSECNKAFQESKNLLLCSRMLMHYDLQKPLMIACDASPYGLGAVLSHTMPDGTDRPVAFASRSLTTAEKNYSQLDKEALAIVWAVKKFHNYIYGRQFTLLTDHKPLLTIFNPRKGISTTTAARLQRYALTLGAYHYCIKYRAHDFHGNADAMSRLPLMNSLPVVQESLPSVCFTGIVHAKQIAKETACDTELQLLAKYLRDGWPRTGCDVQRAYILRAKELTLRNGCILWGERVLVPNGLWQATLKLLHEGHPGIVRMKQKARGHVWWPAIDKDIENYVMACKGCVQAQGQLPRGAVQPWDWPTTPWERLHLDFAGPIEGISYLIIIDAHSKWPEVIPMTRTTTTEVISVLERLFSVFGLPRKLVTDNGPQFVSQDFQNFLHTNGIHHHRTAPYHPATNGQAERFVQTFKRALKALKAEKQVNTKNILQFLQHFLVDGVQDDSQSHMALKETAVDLQGAVCSILTYHLEVGTNS